MSKGNVFAVLASVLTAFLTFPSAQAQTYTQLYSFTGGTDGSSPYGARLARDGSGNLYGTTEAGGDLTCPDGPGYGCGVVYKLGVTGKLTVLHSFTGGAQGHWPQGLLLDGNGNLYGSASSSGNGFVFKVDKTGNYTVLYSFGGGADGVGPHRSLVRDTAGNLYGTTVEGGNYDPSCLYNYGCGTVFELSPTGQHTVLYSFSNSADGYNPVTVIRDGVGNLYGITQDGGQSAWGTVFKLDTTGKKTTLHSFTGERDGGYGVDYYGSLVRDSGGNLYGTTNLGGTYGWGTVFKIDRKSNETVLHAFTGGSDGGFPVFGMVRDTAGNLYGTTESGGTNSCGTVFKLDPAGSLTTLYSFAGGTDGCTPDGDLIQDAAGNLYGATEQGGGVGCGGQGCGTIFKITLYPVAFSPMSLSFPAQTVGTTSAPKTVTLYNNQLVALNITSMVASAEFSAVPGGSKPCGSVVAANSKCTFLVRFSPTTTGTIKGTVTVTDDTPTSPQIMALTGKGK